MSVLLMIVAAGAVAAAPVPEEPQVRYVPADQFTLITPPAGTPKVGRYCGVRLHDGTGEVILPFKLKRNENFDGDPPEFQAAVECNDSMKAAYKQQREMEAAFSFSQTRMLRPPFMGMPRLPHFRPIPGTFKKK